MPRTWKRKTKTGQQTPAGKMKQAVETCVNDGKSIRFVSQALNVPHSTLHRYVENAKNSGVENIRLSPNYANARVFSDTEEQELENYLLLASKHHHGLTTVATKELAYQYAVKNNKDVPQSWKTAGKAGVDWLFGFMKRHHRLSIRKPEATSLSRATSFNRKNVGDFFENVEQVMKKYSFEAGNIYNCDETGITTVHAPPKVIADRTAKQVGRVTSAERGTLVTMVRAINALGNAIPPFFIFPRVHFKDYMLKGAPAGSGGAAHSSGWMTADNFLKWLEHFIKYSHCSVDNRVQWSPLVTNTLITNSRL